MSTILVTGGAGFIGVNAAVRFASDGWRVVVLDNLSRRGAAENLEWLTALHPVGFVRADVRDESRVAEAMREERPDVVLHLAAQVAVTTSVTDPKADFDVNARGTFNVLEGVRCQAPDAFVIYASTNKVYGNLESVGVVEEQTRYRLEKLPKGVSEAQPLDFHSPYGCSKGCADQYTLDYAKTYGLRTVALRQSCIYGSRQFGVEDQGWVAWFLIATELGRTITIYGNGKQVRDVLDVRDLVDLYRRAADEPEKVAGRAFNVGGGMENAISLLDFLDVIAEIRGSRPATVTADWRPGDQPVFVSDNTTLDQALGWRPTICWRDGLKDLEGWVRANRVLFEAFHGVRA